ncbi:16S rRNA processing protein RimM [Mariprofundus micogutta]|uniref:Ribosome maturation factor RimM n=1 Tax=Mariprofundus micogutta TaxID=1921010 RepID=A0A1L8CQV2_9PROT|nr:ribosome maturation factor RimM [Mariprofundus micogutta]GAV21277.1 16S rRNA processing protein RimM [Mariprofundus micogutta]
MSAEALLHIGDILGPHGLKGTLTIYSYTRPAQAIAGYSCWWLGESAETAKSFQVKRCWQHGKRMLAELDGITDCNSAEAFKGRKVWVRASEVTVEEDEFLWEDLIGCEVLQDENDELLGTVTALEEYGAQDNLLIRTPDDADEQGEWLIPFIEEVVVDVNIDESTIWVNLPDGMDVCFTPKS